ncbi:hypothetical protein ACFPVT_09535 [Corynebacterium choanae]|uniref:Uncharacterized protein n=1 Tax=Corynebacterium choanae TaxID=1862358 RepID=A0A3G6JB71_9CORY|nr:hypothetical protein [Corynebacterium choanae]AZA14268.1 hypothetical protein CCHOA_09425 [Corynebacterium choanae]
MEELAFDPIATTKVAANLLGTAREEITAHHRSVATLNPYCCGQQFADYGRRIQEAITLLHDAVGETLDGFGAMGEQLMAQVDEHIAADNTAAENLRRIDPVV